MSPRTYRVFLPLFLAVYLTAGFLTHSQFLGREFYPFFSWALYSDTPRVEVQYTARLLDVGGRPLPAATDLMATPAFHRSPDYWRDVGVLQNFGTALDAGDTARAETLRLLVEANILLEDNVRYEIVKRTYDPLRRRASGDFQESTLGVFIKNRAPGPER